MSEPVSGPKSPITGNYTGKIGRKRAVEARPIVTTPSIFWCFMHFFLHDALLSCVAIIDHLFDEAAGLRKTAPSYREPGDAAHQLGFAGIRAERVMRDWVMRKARAR